VLVVVALVVPPGDAATEAVFSFPASSRNDFTPRPSWPSTSGSFPAPNTISTMTRMKTSSGPPRLKGIAHFPPRARRAHSLDNSLSYEEPIQEPEEERNDDEQHERREVTEDQHQHELSLDAAGRVEPAGALGRAETVALVP